MWNTLSHVGYTLRSTLVHARDAVGRFLVDMAEAYERHMNEPAPCERCRVPYIRKEMRHLTATIPGYSYLPLYCSECIETIKQEYANEPIRCRRCCNNHPRKAMRVIDFHGDRYRFCPSCVAAIQADEAHCHFCGCMPAQGWSGLCAACYSPQRARETRVVTSHNMRAMNAGTQGTLTAHEWLKILDFYQWKCAYCQRTPYEELEHITPIVLGGGTTLKNCRPACRTCNRRKSGHDPEELKHESSLSPQAIIRVQNDVLMLRDLAHFGGPPRCK